MQNELHRHTEVHSQWHYLISFGTQQILGVLEVNGDATEASSSDRDIPPCALFSACQVTLK